MSARQVVDGWVESDGHCRSLMNPGATHIGVGFAQSHTHGKIWVQVFGR
jgi:uncharacterized protein YkwD